MIRKRILPIISVFCFWIISCEAPAAGNYEEVEYTPYEHQENLFTVESQSSGSGEDKRCIHINSTDYIRPEGYTLFCDPYVNSTQNLQRIEVEVEKTYGDSQSGYGVVFNCVRDGNQYSMLVVMINNKQDYMIGRVKNGHFKPLTEGWRYSESLSPKGAGSNTIIVEYNVDAESLNKYKITFKGASKEPASINIADTEDANPDFTNTKYGFVAVVSPTEFNSSGELEVFYKKK